MAGHRQGWYDQWQPHSLVACPGNITSPGEWRGVARLMPLTSWVSFLVRADCLCRIGPWAWRLASAHLSPTGWSCFPGLAPATDSPNPAPRWRLSQTRTLRTGVEESSTLSASRWKRTRGRSRGGRLRLPWGRRGERTA